MRIAPLPGGGLEWARASLETPLGRLSSEWRIDDGRFRLWIEVPEGCTASVELPDGTRHDAASGRHVFDGGPLSSD